MHHSTRYPDERTPFAWKIFDERLALTLAPEFEFLAEHADADELAQLAYQVQREVGDGFSTDAQRRYYNPGPTAGELLAQRMLPMDGGAIRSAFSWHAHRARLLAVARFVRDEAERIRAGMAKRQPRRTA